MPAKSNKDLKTFLAFLKEHSDAISRTNESAIEYLKDQGKKPDIFASDLLKKIKKTQLRINANNNATVFNKLSPLKELAIQKAKDILKSPEFSFLDFMKQERFSLQNKNLENLSQEEIQDILENYLFLKMQNQDIPESNDI